MRQYRTLLERMNPIYLERLNTLQKEYRHTYTSLKESLQCLYHWSDLSFRDVILLTQLEDVANDITIDFINEMFNEHKETLNTI